MAGLLLTKEDSLTLLKQVTKSFVMLLQLYMLYVAEWHCELQHRWPHFNTMVKVIVAEDEQRWLWGTLCEGVSIGYTQANRRQLLPTLIYHSDAPAGAARGLPRLLDIPPLWLVWWPRQGGAHTAMGTPCTLGKGGWVRVREREGVEGDKMQQLKNKASLEKKTKTYQERC